MHQHASRTSRRIAARAAAGMLTLFACSGRAEAQSVEGSFQRSLTVTGPVEIDVQSGSGRIEVTSGQPGRVEISARITAGNWNFFRGTLSAQESVRRIEANPPIEQTGNRVRIGRIDDEQLRNRVSISYKILVPPDTTLLSKTGSGSHVVTGVRGPITATSGSGSIRVREAGGDVRASTGSGSIQADTIGGTFTANSGSGAIEGVGVRGAITVKSGSGGIDVSQSGGGPVEASSGSGSIRLKGLHGGLRASTASGTLTVQGEQSSDWRISTSSGSVTIELAGKPAFALDAHSNSGRIDTQYPVTVTGLVGRRELRGAVNGGGPLLYVRTSSGGIRIK